MVRLVALWKKEWIALSRDVHGLAVLFVMPAAFIVVMSLALSDVFRDGAGRGAEFAVLGGAKLAERLAGERFRLVEPPASEAAAREGVRRGKPGLVLIVGPGEPPTFRVLADPALPPTEIAAFQHRLLGVVLADSFGFDLKSAGNLEVEVVGARPGARPSSVQQNVPAWLIFGMFFVVMPISSLFIVERREGTLARLVSQKVPFSLVLLGRIGPYLVVNLAQAALMLLAGVTLVPWLGGEALALPARWDLLAAVALATSLAAIAWGLLVAVLSRTMEQATVIGGVGNILAAAIGGIMVPRFVMAENMQTLAGASPMGWALEGFHAVMLRQGSAADIAAPCLKLLVLAAALLGAALWAHHRRRA